MSNNIELNHIRSNLYKDDKGRKFVVDYKKQKCYLLSKKQQKQEEVLNNRYIVVILTFAFVGYQINWLTSLVLSIFLFVILDLIYYKLFIESLSEVKCKNFPKKISMIDLYGQDSKRDLLIRIVACTIFPILFIIFVYSGLGDYLDMSNIKENEVAVISLTCALILVCLYIDCICVYLLLEKSKK